MDHSKTTKSDAKKVFKKLGTCSRTFFYILNREFGHTKETEERAADPLAGGILQKGHQCGMLWGSALAVGAEAYRRFNDVDRAIGVAIVATQHVMDSFLDMENTINCRDITHCDFSNKWSFAKYFFSGRFLYCFKMAERWAPEAIQSAIDGLADKNTDLPRRSMSCASEVVKKMGASDEEMVMVAGFAGGLGLSGNACGALSAAIWMNSLKWSKEHLEKSSFFNPNAKKTLNTFNSVTESEMLCHKICKRHFNSLSDHSEFIKNGGCNKLIIALSKT
jgi:hypothetical protein